MVGQLVDDHSLELSSHWINDETLERKSATFACSRLKGRHTNDVLAANLEGIHTEYDT